MSMLHGKIPKIPLLGTEISSLQQVTIMVQVLVHPINLSNNTGGSFIPQLAASGNNVYVTWEDNTPGNNDIFFVASNNNGTSFGTPINLSNNTGGSFDPQIAVSGNNIYVTWGDNTPGNNDIFVISNAQPFGTPINISNNPGTSQNPQIAAS